MDVHCVVCGEPWEQYSVLHDFPKWQAKLFNEGHGCPCCEGVGDASAEVFEEALVSRLINGSDEGEAGGAISALFQDHDKPRPKWEPPADKVLWKCECCGVKVVNAWHDFGYGWEESTSVDAKDCDFDYIYKHRLERNLDLDFAGELDGHKYCEECWKTCDNCDHEGPESDMYTVQCDSTTFKNACCEECVSALEHEDAQESWDNVYASEVRNELESRLEEDYPDDAWDRADAMLDAWIEEQGLPEYEFSCEGARFDVQEIADAILE